MVSSVRLHCLLRVQQRHTQGGNRKVQTAKPHGYQQAQLGAQRQGPQLPISLLGYLGHTKQPCLPFNLSVCGHCLPLFILFTVSYTTVSLSQAT